VSACAVILLGQVALYLSELERIAGQFYVKNELLKKALAMPMKEELSVQITDCHHSTFSQI
jgi:hypothetical protein